MGRPMRRLALAVVLVAGAALAGGGLGAGGFQPPPGSAGSSSSSGGAPTGCSIQNGVLSCPVFDGGTFTSRVASGQVAIFMPSNTYLNLDMTNNASFIRAPSSSVIEFTAVQVVPSSNASSDIGTTALNWRDGWFSRKVQLGTNGGTCTLNGGTPSTCTVTVTAAATCVCSPVGASAVIAATGCAVGLSGTTLTVTSASAATNVVNVFCNK